MKLALALVALVATPCRLSGQIVDATLVPSVSPGEGVSSSVALGGSTAAVRVFEISVDPDGRVHVFEDDGAAWNETAILSAAPGERFGGSLAVAELGDRIFVGAPDASVHAIDCGVVYVFDRTPSGWVQTARIAPPAPAPSMQFGSSVGASGSRLVVGAPNLSAAAPDAGAAYVYESAGTGWVLSGVLWGSGIETKRQFGAAVDIDGDRIVVGADGVATNTGRAHIFERAGTQWQEVATFEPPIPTLGTKYGNAVAIEGDRAVIGAFRAECPVTGPGIGGPKTGSAFVLDRGPSGWTGQQQLCALDADIGDSFGTFVDVQGKVVVVGAPGVYGSNPGGGALYVFYETPAGWQQAAKLVTDDGLGLGMTGALSGDRIATRESNSAALVYRFATLVGEPATVSLSAGGPHALSVDFGPELATAVYVVLGTTSGTSPGTLLDGLPVPLNVDSYSVYCLQAPNVAPLTELAGLLDGFGRTSNTGLVLQPNTFPGLVGLTLDHVALALETSPVPRLVAVSNAASVTFVP